MAVTVTERLESVWLYVAVAGAAMRAQARHPAHLAGRALAAALVHLTEAVGIVIVVDRFGSLAGWNASEVVVLLALGAAGQGLAQLPHRNVDPAELAELVRHGRFDQILTRPVGALPWLLASGTDLRYLGRTVAGVGLLAWATPGAGIEWSPSDVAVVLLAVVCTAGIVLAVFTLGAALALRTVEGSELVNAFTYGGLTLAGFPLEIYGSALRFVFTWMLPFGLAVYVPALVLLDRPSGAGLTPVLLLLSPVMTVALWAVTLLAWRTGVRHYVGAGS